MKLVTNFSQFFAAFTACFLLAQSSVASSIPMQLKGEVSYGKLSDFKVDVTPRLEDGIVIKKYTIKAKFSFSNDPIEMAFSSVRTLSANEIVLIVSASLGPSTAASELQADFEFETEATSKLRINVLEGDPLKPTQRFLGSF